MTGPLAAGAAPLAAPESASGGPATAGLDALVASRLCHDLIGPIGAIGNGLEFVGAGLAASPELSLITESAALAVAKIRFFRIAFGHCGPAETIDAKTLAATLGAACGSGRLAIEWLPEALPRREARLLFLLVLCAESALPRGGRLLVERHPGGLDLRADGQRTRYDETLWAHLLDGRPVPGLTAGQVHFALARRHATPDWRLALDAGETGFTLTARRHESGHQG
jgi:histidine phosphotransferase ChpT